MIIWQASRLSERVCLCGWACRSLHFLGWKYHALARSAASERMRGNAPLPLAMDLSGESLGVLGLCPQRLPIELSIGHRTMVENKPYKVVAALEFFVINPQCGRKTKRVYVLLKHINP